MPRRGKRKRLDRCIYQDKTGPCIVVAGREHRKGLHGLTLAQLRTKRAELERRYRGSGRTTTARGTLAAAVDQWDSQEKHLASYVSRRAELRAWVKALGSVPLARIEAADVRRVMGTWTAAKVAPKTIRNRLWSLQHLYRIILGPGSETPVDHVEPPAKVRSVITPVSVDIILGVYQRLVEGERKGTLRDAKSRARFMVCASTGRRWSEIKRTLPQDVDLEQRTWRVRDGKGGWSEGLYLNDEMIAAWRVFAEAEAWGDFESNNMARVLATAGWPKGVRPYNLRHSLGIAISERGADLADVGGWLGHTSVQTTRSAYVPILNSRMQRISEALEGRLRGWDTEHVNGVQ